MSSTNRLPVVFIGHGNPMNALAATPFTHALADLGVRIPRPKAILCVSAHWWTESTWITAMEQPRTIHDFDGFPQDLFDIQYPAPGSPELALSIQESIAMPRLHPDRDMWGLDHGTWSVLRHMYPQADVPVLQLSLNCRMSMDQHVELGQKLKQWRDQGVLIVGSGNIVHNLRQIAWERDAPPYPWAVDFDAWVKNRIEARDVTAIIKDVHATEAGRVSVPTWDHWLPLLYVLGAANDTDRLEWTYEGIENASISMRTFCFWDE